MRAPARWATHPATPRKRSVPAVLSSLSLPSSEYTFPSGFSRTAQLFTMAAVAHSGTSTGA